MITRGALIARGTRGTCCALRALGAGGACRTGLALVALVSLGPRHLRDRGNGLLELLVRLGELEVCGLRVAVVQFLRNGERAEILAQSSDQAAQRLVLVGLGLVDLDEVRDARGVLAARRGAAMLRHGQHPIGESHHRGLAGVLCKRRGSRAWSAAMQRGITNNKQQGTGRGRRRVSHIGELERGRGSTGQSQRGSEREAALHREGGRSAMSEASLNHGDRKHAVPLIVGSCHC